MTTIDTRSDGVERFVGTPSYPFGIAVSQGRVKDFDRALVLAFFDAIGTTEGIVWPGYDVQVFPDSPLAPVQMSVSSESVNDTALGSHMQSCLAEVLNADYDTEEHLLQTDGQNPVLIPGEQIRIQRLVGVTAGAPENSNDGRVWVGSGAVVGGVPAVKYMAMGAGHGRSMQATYTIPAQRKAYAVSALVNSGRSAVGETRVRFMVRPPGGMWVDAGPFILGGGAPLPVPQGVPGEFGEKTDFGLRALATQGTIDVSLFLEILTREYHG